MAGGIFCSAFDIERKKGKLSTAVYRPEGDSVNIHIVADEPSVLLMRFWAWPRKNQSCDNSIAINHQNMRQLFGRHFSRLFFSLSLSCIRYAATEIEISVYHTHHKSIVLYFILNTKNMLATNSPVVSSATLRYCICINIRKFDWVCKKFFSTTKFIHSFSISGQLNIVNVYNRTVQIHTHTHIIMCRLLLP